MTLHTKDWKWIFGLVVKVIEILINHDPKENKEDESNQDQA